MRGKIKLGSVDLYGSLTRRVRKPKYLTATQNCWSEHDPVILHLISELCVKYGILEDLL